MTRPTRKQFLKGTGLTQSAIARVLNITRQAVCRWGDGPIPEKSLLILRHEIRPGMKRKHSATAEEIQAVYSFFNGGKS